MTHKTQHNRGVIKDNAQHALVRSNVFRPKVEAKAKGKGSFKRQAKHKRRCEVFSSNGFFVPICPAYS